MSDLAEDLRAFLIGTAEIQAIIGQRVHQDHVPQNMARPYIWLRQSGVEEDPCLDGAVGADPLRVFFDIECCATVNATSKELAGEVRGVLHHHRGQLGTRSVPGVFVREHDDDYVPRNGGDPGIYVATFSLEIVLG